MKDSKFTNWTNEGGFRIPPAALTMAKISQGEKLDFHVADDVIVTLKHKMTALEMIHAIDALNELSSRLLTELAEVCGSCDECVGEDEPDDFCPCGQDFEGWNRLAQMIRKAVDIPEGVKVTVEADKAARKLIFSEADYPADLTDVPKRILDVLDDYDVRLCVLERHLMKGDIIHG